MTRKATFSFTAGALTRSRAIFQLMKGARLRGIAINVIDDGGWLQTEYCVTVEGDELMVKDYLQALERAAKASVVEG